MARFESVESVSIPASAALASLDQDAIQFTGVVIEADGRANHPALLGDQTVGVAMSGAKAEGQVIDIAFSGVVKMKLAADVTAGERLTCTAAGLAQPTGVAEHTIGKALASGVFANGDIVDVLLVSQGIIS